MESIEELAKNTINNIKECLENEDNICPIGREPMTSPITITTSGQTYEKYHLNNYF